MTDGYSGTPLPRKLGIREGDVVALLHAPPGWEIAGLPDGVTVRHDLRARPDTTLAFFREVRELRREVGRLVGAVRAAAAIWVLWPRKAAGHDSDITENAIRDLLLPTGLVDVKVAAVGEDWSGLRFVLRRDRR